MKFNKNIINIIIICLFVLSSKTLFANENGYWLYTGYGFDFLKVEEINNNSMGIGTTVSARLILGSLSSIGLESTFSYFPKKEVNTLSKGGLFFQYRIDDLKITPIIKIGMGGFFVKPFGFDFDNSKNYGKLDAGLQIRISDAVRINILASYTTQLIGNFKVLPRIKSGGFFVEYGLIE